MWKFPGQGSNLHHRSDPSHSSDNTRSLTHQATRELISTFSNPGTQDIQFCAPSALGFPSIEWALAKPGEGTAGARWDTDFENVSCNERTVIKGIGAAIVLSIYHCFFLI